MDDEHVFKNLDRVPENQVILYCTTADKLESLRIHLVDLGEDNTTRKL